MTHLGLRSGCGPLADPRGQILDGYGQTVRFGWPLTVRIEIRKFAISSYGTSLPRRFIRVGHLAVWSISLHRQSVRRLIIARPAARDARKTPRGPSVGPCPRPTPSPEARPRLGSSGSASASRLVAPEHRSKPPGSPDVCVGLEPARSSVLDARAPLVFEPARVVRTPGGRPWIAGASDRRPIRRADPLHACAPDLSTRSTPPREFGATCETSVDFSLSAPHLSAGDRHHDNFRRQS